jgi:methyl-accepting chemotaxis protein
MDKVTQGNAAAAEESAASAEELTSQSEQLRSVVSELRILVQGSDAGSAVPIVKRKGTAPSKTMSIAPLRPRHEASHTIPQVDHSKKQGDDFMDFNVAA